MPITVETLDYWFTYHPPRNDEELAGYFEIRKAARAFAETILLHTPSCADQTVALRHVRDAVMTANAAIALQGR